MEADRGFHVWRQVIERRAAAWVESQPRDPAGRDPGMLLRGRELVTASERLEERGEDLGKQERCYIMASTALDQLEREKEQQRVEEQRREERRRRIGLGMISVLAVLVVGVATFAWYRDREADRDRRIQERATFSRQLADTAVRETGGDTDLALLLGIEANRIANTRESQDALVTALAANSHLDAMMLLPDGLWVDAMAFNEASGFLTSVSESGSVVTWDVETGQQRSKPIPILDNGFSVFAFDPTGAILASGAQDGTISLWKADTGERLIGPIPAHAGFVDALAFSNDGQTVVSGGFDGTISLWNAHTGERLLEPIEAHADQVTALAFDPDGKVLASAGCANPGEVQCLRSEIRQWDVKTGASQGHPFGGGDNGLEDGSLAFAADGQVLITHQSDDTVVLWDVAADVPVGQSVSGGASAMAVSRDGWKLAVAQQHQVVVWDLSTDVVSSQVLTGNPGFVDLGGDPRFVNLTRLQS